MIQTNIDHITSNEKNNFSSLSFDPQPITSTSSSFTPLHANDKPHTINDSIFDSDTQNLSSSNNNNHNNNTEDDNIDWEYVTKQLESKLQNSSVDFIPSQSDDSYYTKLPPKTPKKHRFRPITNHGSTVSQQTSLTTTTTDNMTLHSVLLQKQPNQIETNSSTYSTQIDHTSTLHDLFHQLIIYQEKQAVLLKQIHQLINQPKESCSILLESIPRSSSFFLPLNSLNSNPSLSLQDAFQQRKSSFIQESKKRVNDIYRENNKYHHRIIPDIKQTNNTYLQERRQYENNRLCAMIIKHQNRQNAKIYGNKIKNQLCHN